MLDKWEIKQIMDLVSKSLNSLLINTNKQWTEEKLKEKAFQFMNVYCDLLRELKQKKIEKGLPKIDDKGNVAVEEDEHLEEDLEKLEEVKEQKIEEIKRDLLMQEAILEGKYSPLPDLPNGNWREPTPEETKKVFEEVEKQHTEHLVGQ